jgi:hypothetical protein
MISTNHNSDRRAAPSAYSRGEAAFISRSPAIPNHAGANSNRHSLVRLEFAVTPTKQRPEMSSNRHNRAVRPAHSRPTALTASATSPTMKFVRKTDGASQK